MRCNAWIVICEPKRSLKSIRKKILNSQEALKIVEAIERGAHSEDLICPGFCPFLLIDVTRLRVDQTCSDYRSTDCKSPGLPISRIRLRVTRLNTGLH